MSLQLISREQKHGPNHHFGDSIETSRAKEVFVEAEKDKYLAYRKQSLQ